MIFDSEMPHSNSAPGLASRLHVGVGWHAAARLRRFTGPGAIPQSHLLCISGDDFISFLAVKAVTGFSQE